MLHDVLLLTSEIACRVRPRSERKAQAGMIVANRMAPPHDPLGPSRHSSRRQRTAEDSAGMPPDTPITYRPPGQFRSAGEYKTNFSTGPHVANVGLLLGLLAGMVVRRKIVGSTFARGAGCTTARS